MADIITPSTESFYRGDSKTITWAQMPHIRGVTGNAMKGEICSLSWAGGSGGEGWCHW